MKDIESKSLKELKQYCRDNGIKGFSKYKKNNINQLKELIIENTDNNNDEDKVEDNNEDKVEDNNEDKEITIKNMEGFKFLKEIDDKSINLILTDPPYITSRESGMNNFYNKIEDNIKNKVEFVKTEEEWEDFVKNFNKDFNLTEKNKENYIKYGSPYGKKYAVKTDYGDWDKEFTIELLEEFIKEYYNKLVDGGTLIIFFDLWKITILKDLMEKYKFKQIRFIEWIKTNPQPLNSKINYLTNCREIALVGVKKGKPTFNSKYDNGIYMYPLQGGKNRFHPTQKSLKLFEELIRKHTKDGDKIMDTFLGSGTTALACKNLNKNFVGCEIDKEYYDKIIELIG
jgi:site-specific DNA-methyltransferase (adenine-specific)